MSAFKVALIARALTTLSRSELALVQMLANFEASERARADNSIAYEPPRQRKPRAAKASRPPEHVQEHAAADLVKVDEPS